MKKEFLTHLGFTLKDNSVGIYLKKYHDNSIIEIDFENQTIHFGGKIKIYDKDFQKITKPEDWVVFECVNRLLEKGYKSEDILLEKVYPTGRGTSGRLDILVKKDDKAFLMIECKTFGGEFEKEFKNMQRNGGQLFTYFQQDRDSEFLILYTSNFNGNEIEYKNEIVKIEESYKETSNVEDLYIRWNKFTKNNGVFDDWVNPYCFESKSLTYDQLEDIKESDASFIFNRFLEILRHNTVSDKPNAFNKMFTLFLCKIYDELDKKDTNKELDFQWKEGIDSHVSFQKKLSDLYKKGMLEFLNKQITDFSDKEINDEFGYLDENSRQKILEKFTKIRLQKSNEFAIKEVNDDESFEENAKVLKEVVELLQKYKFRYSKKQPFLGDFFELLLTTGLKQESGQFFTPVPVARFICRSIPLEKIIDDKIKEGNANDILPTVIDYAAGSGHFIIESMEEIQKIVNKKDVSEEGFKIKDIFKKYKENPYDWAGIYTYGIEKDYRLVKTAKVGCYLHGDGIATVIHGDGLDSFEFSKNYRGKLNDFNSEDKQENAKFDLVLSNPPYSVSAFKGNLDREKAEKDFDLYNGLSDKSSEIECLFIERTKQLLKEGGIAAIVLPNTILNKGGIYTKAREILLKNFEIISIVELGSNTFMATDIKSVILFMKKRNKFFAKNLEASINKFFVNLADISLNNIENVFSIYVNYVWGVSFEDYKTLLQKFPNEIIKKHELYLDYTKKKKINEILEIEKDKILYFIISYNSDLVLVKSGEKQEEKEFLGYEFSERGGKEGIRSTKKGKLIDDCTKLFDSKILDNESKVSTYIYDGFNNKFDREINKYLENHISRKKLVDLFSFNEDSFDKSLILEFKEKVNFENIWGTNILVRLGDISIIQKGKSITKANTKEGLIPVIAGGQQPAYFHNEKNRDGNIITVSASGAYAGFINYFDIPIFASDCNTILSKNEDIISTKLVYEYLKAIQLQIYKLQRGQAQPHVYGDDLEKIKIPLPALEIQQKIVDEIEKLEEKAKTVVINDLQEQKEIILKKYL